jgi:hypothetical protein
MAYNFLAGDRDQAFLLPPLDSPSARGPGSQHSVAQATTPGTKGTAPGS